MHAVCLDGGQAEGRGCCYTCLQLPVLQSLEIGAGVKHVSTFAKRDDAPPGRAQLGSVLSAPGPLASQKAQGLPAGRPPP